MSFTKKVLAGGFDKIWLDQEGSIFRLPMPATRNDKSSERRRVRVVEDTPFVIFSVALCLLALTCTYLALYIVRYPIPNPNIQVRSLWALYHTHTS